MDGHRELALWVEEMSLAADSKFGPYTEILATIREGGIEPWEAV